MIKRVILIALAAACGQLAAGDLASATTAKFVRVILLGTGVKTVACADRDLAWDLGQLGVVLDPDSKVAWADTEKDVARFAKGGKLVICGSKALLASGATLAVAAEGGHPVIFANLRALAATNMTLPDNILKLAKVAQ